MIAKTRKNHFHLKRTGNTLKSLYQQGGRILHFVAVSLWSFYFCVRWGRRILITFCRDNREALPFVFLYNRGHWFCAPLKFLKGAWHNCHCLYCCPCYMCICSLNFHYLLFIFNFHLNLFHTFLHSRLSESRDSNQIVVPVFNKSRVFIRFVIV